MTNMNISSYELTFFPFVWSTTDAYLISMNH